MNESSTPHPGVRYLRPGLARFVHQLTHDLRNDLAAVEVFATTASASGDLGLVQEALAEISATVAACGRRLAALRGTACLEIPVPQMLEMGVTAWIDGIRQHVDRHPAAPFVTWCSECVADGVLCSDPSLVAAIIDELLANALRCGRGASTAPWIQVELSVLESRLMVKVRQPIVDELAVTDVGGLDLRGVRVPALSATKHHYGFGLSAAVLRAEAVGAEISVAVDCFGNAGPWFTAVLKLPLTS